MKSVFITGSEGFFGSTLRVKKFANLLEILKEKIIILVTFLKLKKYYNLILNVKNKFLNINTYKPLDC
jgi:hypothetical protein